MPWTLTSTLSLTFGGSSFPLADCLAGGLGPGPEPVSAGTAAGWSSTLSNQAAQVEQASQAEVLGLMKAHDAVNKRWLDYELDVGKLIDFPVMTDVREPPPWPSAGQARPTPCARRPRGRQDGCQGSPNTGLPSRSFWIAFDVAEREAKRIRDSKFTGPERQRLETARKLLRIASDAAATPAERQTAYRRARRELDGLIVLPEAFSLAALEDRIASMLDAGPAADARRTV